MNELQKPKEDSGKLFEFNIGEEHSITIFQKPNGETSSMLHSEVIGGLPGTKKDHTYVQHSGASPLGINPKKSLEDAFRYVVKLRKCLGANLKFHKKFRKEVDRMEFLLDRYKTTDQHADPPKARTKPEAE